MRLCRPSLAGHGHLRWAVNLRVGPSTATTRLATLPADSPVSVDAWTTDSLARAWYHRAGAVPGWIYADAVLLDRSMTPAPATLLAPLDLVRGYAAGVDLTPGTTGYHAPYATVAAAVADVRAATGHAARPGALGLAHAAAARAPDYSWLNSTFIGKDAKLAPDFLSGTGLAARIIAPQTGFVHTALMPWVATFLTGVVVPHAALFAWLLTLGGFGVGVSLLFGLCSRLGGVGAIFLAVVNILVAGGATNAADTIGHNYLLALVGLVVIISAAGRAYGLDRLLIARFPDARLLRLIA